MIELANIVYHSEVNGPFERSVIWVQGCRKRCPGCWNQNFLKFGSSWKLTPEKIFDLIKENTNSFKSIEGITFSGGEPFEQSSELAILSHMFRQSGLGIMSYSGYIRGDIEAESSKKSFLDQIDLLVDGEYIRDLACDRLWRSSSNQQVHFLSERYRSFEKNIDNDNKEFEIVISSDKLSITGFPDTDLLTSLKKS